ncbi:RrF2 family transcriptional regulator [Acrocarpospora catenulata]|uniref:RrF2 family transcriptional regulator n=1 Tax=Acrocarpospora catenulata TaxID=2836182 RepID=UPI001BD96883|nr:Rrf2 family transcriptional regulator [Acrocarpospora catenulata]
MRLSARTDYALRAVIELAATGGGPTSAVEVAQAQQIPRQFLDLILRDLRRAGLITSQRGSTGGFLLARKAGEISLADVIRAVDGPLATIRGEAPQDLRYEGSAQALQFVWIALRADLRALLENVTIENVVTATLPEHIMRSVEVAAAWKSSPS